VEHVITASSGRNEKIILPGGAGLVGQNLVVQLKARGYRNIVVLDKHAHNLQVLSRLHPDVTAELTDLAETGVWERHFGGADAMVMLQAQIGGSKREPYLRNNVTATANILDAIKKYQVPYALLVSSSVVESVADDDYTNTKKAQEELVLRSDIPHLVLRPTLMFGWFDRKHLGWLSRFMLKSPVFPIPGDGRFIRQPLYVRDFCAIVLACLEQRISGQVLNITGREQVAYVDIIRQIKQASKAKAAIVSIPYGLFYVLLKVWAVFDRNPPFTAGQLKALVANDLFEVIDWPAMFGVAPTPFRSAIEETFNDPVYSQIILEF
jgi:nucleoside-diphosphate-sugar epimerase